MIEAAHSAAWGNLHDFWKHWGFSPWNLPPFVGVSRRQSFVKSGILGRVADFGALDHIIWESGTEEERMRLWQSRRSIPEIMTQRFLFLLENPWPERRIRSFAWGFRGYVEFYAFLPNGGGSPKAHDLSGLVDLGFKLLEGDQSERTVA
jgi:hypothetical protein